MTSSRASQPTGYDKTVNFRTLALVVSAFAVLLVVPTPWSMRDVAVEYSLGEERVLDLISQRLFGDDFDEIEQWQAMSARILEANMRQGALHRSAALARDRRSVERLGLRAPQAHMNQFQQLIDGMGDDDFQDMMTAAYRLRHVELDYDELSNTERARADRATWHLKVAIALVGFVVLAFLTEAIPLPGVAFCIGLILVFTGVVSYRDIAALFWSDACWFIMGSLMFAAAFVKTGVDRRICLVLFSRLAKPSIWVISAILIGVISPAAAFISDHALAAMFLPVVMILYSNSVGANGKDSELGKMLMLTVAMACNIGGFGSPSGGARNVIIMTYLEDMFGVTIGYGQWIVYGMPFVIIMMPILWLVLLWRFRPEVKDLGPALRALRGDIERSGGWNRKQVIAVVIFLLMLVGWITEKNLLVSLTGLQLGIGVIAVLGAVAYLVTGVVSWRDYQERVDWGVVWLYAGAIVFGRVLDSTGAAYWMARSVVEGMAGFGLESHNALLAVGGVVTAGITNLMADGPAAAAVGPVTLNMAAVAAPGTTLVPFMGLITSCASSMAYLMIIGTPPNAIVYASGLLKPRDFLRVGLPCFVLAFVVMMLLSAIYWPALGFEGLRPM